MKSLINYTSLLLMMLLSNLNIAQNSKAPCTATIITQSQEMCDDFFQVSAEAPEAGETALWEGPPGTAFTDPGVPVTFITGLASGPNIITCSIFDAAGDLCDTDSITLTNNEVITTPIIITQYDEVCDENGVELTAMPSTAPGEYGVWSSDNSTVTFSPNDTTPNVTANNLALGNNIFFWEIRNGTCVANPASITLNLVDCEVFVENPIFSELTLMPNPATSIINLSQTMTNAQLHIYSAIGQKIMSDDNFSGSQINIQTLPNGIYFIVIYGQENYLAKMVKESQ